MRNIERILRIGNYFNSIYGKKLAICLGMEIPEIFIRVDLFQRFSRELAGCNNVTCFRILKERNH
jgi:hypothetical protein